MKIAASQTVTRDYPAFPGASRAPSVLDVYQNGSQQKPVKVSSVSSARQAALQDHERILSDVEQTHPVQVKHRAAPAKPRLDEDAVNLRSTKNLDEFVFNSTAINEALVREIHAGGFLRRLIFCAITNASLGICASHRSGQLMATRGLKYHLAATARLRGTIESPY